ncbi:hypothetical protein [Tenacibaculum sp. L6]|uniref:hypothetical protein n=1 Tax=Tenacibaculum sp. L6 TaxID=2992764 RepID=UPI00237B4CFD|nr:hypothetical protein [Tenacibaculum sp. L6]MDE0535588.1 hypothetical protein [Tenacibaculum sp. L6]
MKKNILLITLLFLTLDIFAHDSEVNKTIVKNGIGLGSVIAVVISWDRNKSILLAIIHGMLSWLYVIYYFFTREDS